RMPAIAERVDHRVLKMSAAPPGDEAMRLAVPTLALEERRHSLGQPLLHIDNGAVLIERQRLDLASENLVRCHGVPLRSREGLPGVEGARRQHGPAVDPPTWRVHSYFTAPTVKPATNRST